MENTPITTCDLQSRDFDFQLQHQEEQNEDALSLCDLPLHDDNGESEENPKTTASSSPDPHGFFEFCVDPIHGYFPMDVVFCGKSIPCSKPIVTIPPPEPQIENPLFSRSESFKFSHSSPFPARSSSLRPSGLEMLPVNFRSQSSNSRKHKVLIGLVTYHPEMDMNEIRKRQMRRAPAPLIPVKNGGEKQAIAGGRSGSRKGHWGLVRPFRCRSHLLSALAKATLGCMSHV